MLRRAAGVFDSSHANAVREAKRAQEAAAAHVAAEQAQKTAWRLHCQALQQEAWIAAANAAEEEEEAAAEKAILDDATRYTASRPVRGTQLLWTRLLKT